MFAFGIVVKIESMNSTKYIECLLSTGIKILLFKLIVSYVGSEICRDSEIRLSLI